MEKKLILIDGHSILNRAFYGVPELTNAAGLHTNAIYGFLNIMFKIMEEEKAQYLAVAFDVSAPTFRHEIYKEYKGTRKPMADELREQVPIMKEVLKAMGIMVMEKAGLEADDILGTMAKRGEQEGYLVALVSGDRDLLQIASDKIKIRIPKTKSGRTEVEDYFAKDVQEKYQVNPQQFIELKALMGDSSDNIPGVPKVGEKTATELMVQYGSLENIYDHLEEISKKSIRESLRENKELADLSKVLATINTQAEISYEISDAKIDNLYTKEAYKWFQQLEFKNMLSRFDGAVQTEGNGISKEHFQKPETEKEFAKIKNSLMKESAVSVLVWVSRREEETDADGQFSLFEQPVLEKRTICCIGTLSGAVYFLDSRIFGVTELKDFIRRLYEADLEKVTFAVKEFYDYLDLSGVTSRKACENIFDAALAAYLINPLKSDYKIEDIANEHLGLFVTSYEQLFGKADFETVSETEPFTEYACTAAHICISAYPVLQERLRDMGMEELFRDMEMPVSYILYAMQKEGMLVDAKQLKAYGNELQNSIEILEQRIYEEAGKEFNINSPKQLGEILFGEMNIPGGKKTKTGYSTSAEVLEKLAPDYPLIRDVLEYRTLAKLKSTYADGLSAFIGKDGRIHSNFNQTITATGRISSTEPNLQNIPMRMELGRKIRKVFIPREGYVLADADYSQIELRILASLSSDEELIAAYKTNEDIHKMTASKVFHVPLEEVTDLQRRNAKAVNFGIVYGISSFGLSQDLSISKKEAASYIEEYFATYPGIKSYLERTKEEAKEKGYSLTGFHRRRPIPELSSSNFMQRAFGERVAMNAPIQGTAADVMKLAMIRVFDRLLADGLRAKLILQVHDELVIETPKEEEEQVLRLMKEEMMNAADFAVELVVEAHSGKDWYEAK